MSRLVYATLRNFPFLAPAALATAIGCGMLAFVVGTDLRLQSGALAHPDSSQLQIVAASFPEREVNLAGIGTQPLRDLQRAQSRSPHEIEIPLLSTPRTLPLQAGDELLTVRVELADSEALQLLGVRPRAGRLLSPEDRNAAAPLSAVATSTLIEQLGSRDATALIGRRFQLKGQALEIVGVTEPSYRGALWQSVDLVIPVEAMSRIEGPHYLDDAAVAWLLGLTRVADERDASDLAALLGAATSSLREGYPNALDGLVLTSLPLQDILLGSAAPRALGTLRWAAVFLYALCVGTSVLLLLAMLEARRSEFEVRTALGGSNLSQMVRTCGWLLPWSIAAAGLAIMGMRQLGPQLVRASGLTPPSTRVGTVGTFEIGLAITLVAFALLVQLLVVVRHFRRATAEGRIGDGREGRTAGGLRLSLVTAQLAVAMVLVAGAFATHAAVGRILDQPSGLNEQVLVSPVSWSSDPTPAERRADRQRVTNTFESVHADVQTAWAGPNLPPNLVMATALRRAGSSTDDAIQAFRSAVSDELFELLDIPLISGRLLDGRDQPDTQPGMVISESSARALFGDQESIGAELVANPAIQGVERWTVVGVVGDIEGRGFGEPRMPNHDVYVSLRQAPEASLHLLAQRRDGSPAGAEIARTLSTELEGRAVVLAPRTLEAHYADQADNERFARRLATLFSVFAALVALSGLYGSLSLHLRQRQKELAIRAALGATPVALSSMLARTLLRLVAASALLGTALAVALFRWAALGESSLVSASFVPLLLALLVILAGTVLAAVGPWLRMLRDDPARRLRADSPWTP